MDLKYQRCINRVTFEKLFRLGKYGRNVIVIPYQELDKFDIVINKLISMLINNKMNSLDLRWMWNCTQQFFIKLDGDNCVYLSYLVI